MTLSAVIRQNWPGFAMDVSFSARPGVTALFGRSGAGKTTVVNAVAGLLRPDFARITLGDLVLSDTATQRFLPPHRRRIGYVFQDARLFPHLSVRANLDYGRRFAPRAERPPAARFDEVVSLLGIAALLDRRPGALSGGEKQRVALGRAILSAPRLLLMDEPLAALDEARKAAILPYLENLRALGLPILYVSHSLAEITRLADHVVMLDAGRVAAEGPAARVLSDPASAAALGRETGALLIGRFAGPVEDGLALLETDAGALHVARHDLPPDLASGATVRLRVLASDVMLALDVPQGISALNVLAGHVDRIDMAPDGSVLVRLLLATGNGSNPPDTAPALLSRITARSLRQMGLRPGQPVHAILKSVSITDIAARPAPVMAS